MSRDDRHIDRSIGLLEGEAASQTVPEDPSRAGGSPPFEVATGSPSEDYRTTGYFDRPVVKEPVWIWSVPVYFYVGGVAGAASVLGAALQVTDGKESRSLTAKCRRIAAVGCGISAALLVYDLGRPGRFLNMLRVFRPTSALNVGSWILAASGSLSTAAAVSGESSGIVRSAGDAAGLLAGIVGLPLTGYTAVLVSDTSVPIWHAIRRTLPALFVSSAAGSAADVLEFGSLTEREQRVVSRFGKIGKVAELFTTFLVERDATRVERVGRPFKEGVSGGLWKAAKALTGASLGLSLLPGTSRPKRYASALLGAGGTIAMKFAVFHAGKASARDPRATFEQQRS